MVEHDLAKVGVASTKVYGDADPSLTYQVSGLRNGDSAGSILTGGLNRDAGWVIRPESLRQVLASAPAANWVIRPESLRQELTSAPAA